MYRDFGLKGLAERWIQLFMACLSFLNPARLENYLVKYSGLYANLVRFRHDIFLTQQAQATISARALRSIDDLDISAYKTSNRLFILGSGSSVNDLTDADWAHIASSDSVGFNFWMVHDFVPTYYFFEPPYNLPGDPWGVLLQLFELRKTDYLNTRFVCDYKEWQHYDDKLPIAKIPPEIVRNMYFFAPYYLRLNNKTLISLVLWYWRFFKIKKARLEDLILQRATLSALIMFGVFAGYKEIVLVGIDLDTAYFWEENSALKHTIRPITGQKGRIHKTADPEIDVNRLSIPIDQYIDLLDQIVLRPQSISLFIASGKSRLYPRLKKYEFPSS